MSKVREILFVKGEQVHTIAATCSLLEAVKKMHELKIGCLVVTGAASIPKGMITERDVLRVLATEAARLADMAVEEAMTTTVIVCSQDDSLDHVRSLMKERFVRQLPVLSENGELTGIVSLGDVNAHMIREHATEIRYLHDYVHGRVR